MAYEEELPRSTFPEGEGPGVAAGIFCHLFRSCVSCPGILVLTPEQANLSGLEAGTAVFCVHWSHKHAPIS
jgi:hypothetical protein